MAYTPINVDVYTAAYSGAIAGMAVSGWITDPTSADYESVCVIAGAYAQQFDVVWNNATQVNNLEYKAITSVSQDEFAGRGPGPLANPAFQVPAYWDQPARACAALVLQSDAFFTGQGIDPGTPGGSSDHKVKVTVADTTPGFLTSKIVPGTGVSFATLNPGADEQLEISASASGEVLHFNYFVDNLAGGGGDGTIAKPFNNLQTAIDFAVLQSTNWTIYLTNTAISYGDIVWTFNGGNCQIVGLANPDSLSGVVIGDVIFHTINPGQSGVLFQNLTSNNILDVSAGFNVNFTEVNAGHSSLVGSDFTIWQVSNSFPTGTLASSVPSQGTTSAVLSTCLFNGFVGGIDSIEAGVAYNTTFNTTFPSSSVGAWELHDCTFINFLGPAILVGADIDSATEKAAMISGSAMSVTGVGGLSLLQNDCVGMTDADQTYDYSGATRVVADQNAITANRKVVIGPGSGKDNQLFKYDDWHTAHTITFEDAGNPGVTIATAPANAAGEGFQFVFGRSAVAGNPIAFLWVTEL